MTPAEEPGGEISYLLDTSVISDFVKGESGVVSKLLSIPPWMIAVSAVSRMEVEYGLLLNEARAHQLRSKIEAFFDTVHVMPFFTEDATSAAAVRAELKKAGTPIGPYDILLAGTALRRDLIFVTSNVNEFKRVKGLKLENWRS